MEDVSVWTSRIKSALIHSLPDARTPMYEPAASPTPQIRADEMIIQMLAFQFEPGFGSGASVCMSVKAVYA